MAVKFGITRHSGLYVEGVGVEDTIQTAVLKGSKGVDKIIHPYNKTTKFNLKTRGEDSELAVGVGDPGITGIEGGATVIESKKYDEVNTDFPTSDVSGSNYPEGTVLELDEE